MYELRTIGIAATVSLLAGCAVPIRSNMDDPAKPLVGIQYFLTASQITAKVSARLETCSPAQVVLLKPTFTPEAVADESASYTIDPRDAWNLFRAIDTADVSLTADRRLGAASAKVTDKTVETFSELIKAAAGVVGMLAKEGAKLATKPSTQPRTLTCTDRALELVTERIAAQAQLDRIQSRRATMLSSATPSQGFGETVAALDAAIKAQQDAVEILKAKLTKTAQLQIQPKVGEPKAEATAVIDLEHGWFGIREPATACTLKKLDVENCLVATLSITAASTGCEQKEGPDCAKRKKDAFVARAQAERVAFGETTYAGLLYRVPSNEQAVVSVRRNAGPDDLAVALEAGYALPQASFKMPLVLPVRGTQDFKSTPDLPVPQWGRMAAIPSDIGNLTSNSVKVTFDDWGVPKGISYSASPATIPQMLGLVSQANAAFHPKAPAEDPAAASRAALLQQLLQYCLEAPASAVPSYCAGLTK